jgi:predicted AlkP superfamily pyrophosphatase or phosphodiesterase
VPVRSEDPATVVVLLDAFRWDYLDPETTPFLANLAISGHHFRRVVPSLGYCERIELLTGRPAVRSDAFCALGRDPGRAPYRWVRPVRGMLRWLELGFGAHLLRRVLSRVSLLLQEHGMRAYRIPWDILWQMALTEDYRDHWDPLALDGDSIVHDVLEAQGTVFFKSFTSLKGRFLRSDRDRLDAVLAAAPDGHRLYLVYVSLPDQLGHEHGPGSPELLRGLTQMDADLRDLVSRFGEIRPQTDWLLIGDHGMVSVEDSIDAGALLKKAADQHGLEVGVDFLLFLDSTIVRIWWDSEAARSTLTARFVEEVLGASWGEVLFAEGTAAESAPSASLYGDVIWMARPGVVIVPDFFQSPIDVVKGMHGYDPSVPGCQGTAVHWGPSVPPGSTASLTLASLGEYMREQIGQP